MGFEKNFCSSPWFHTRIDSSGRYEYCRWATKDSQDKKPSINEVTPIQWFQHGMKGVRKSLLSGEELLGCKECRVVEQHGKISGRLRQLLKVGITRDSFDKTMLSSAWFLEFKDSLDRDGITDQWPQDWQIDLGNFCNSACLFCTPQSSSRLAAEYKKLGFIDRMPDANWCDSPENLETFIRTLEQSPRLSYLHFIGGETLITPAFETILRALVERGLSQRVTIGFTTNLTVWNQTVIDLLMQFKEINLGMSIECVHPLNNYVRYGSELTKTMELLERWVDLAKQKNWLMQLRITPTVFTIWHLDTIYDYAYENQVSVESCNFLEEPAHMRPNVLPLDLRKSVIEKLQKWISSHGLGYIQKQIVNTRDPNIFHQQLIEDAQSYVDYLITQPDESHRLKDLIRYIKIMESNRGNSILDYLPEYETLLRSAGY